MPLNDLDDLGFDDRDLARVHGAREAVDGESIAFLERERPEADRPIVSYVQCFAARHADFAHLARHHCRVGGHASP